MPTLNDVLAGSQAQAVQVQQIIDALKGTPNKGVPVALVSLNDPNNYALTVQNDDPVNSRALSVLKADGTTLISADATGVTLGAPINVPAGSLSGTQLANASVTNAKLGSDTARLNLLTNGGFEIWQRGISFTPLGGSSLGPDRWVLRNHGSTSSLNCSRDTTHQDVAGLTCAACVFTAGTGGSGATAAACELAQENEFDQLRGKAVSLSVRVSTTTANAVRPAISTDNGATFTYGAYHSGGGTYETLTLPNVAIPANATGIRVGLQFVASCTAYIDNAMLVVGSQYADYAPAHPADDLARCLRYYEIIGDTPNNMGVSAYQSAGGALQLPLRFSVRKAVAPTVTKNGTWAVANCAQPSLVFPGADGCMLATSVTALGAANFANDAVGKNITVEANP